MQSVQSGLDCSAIAVATQELLYPYEYEVKNLDVCVKQENSHAPQFIHQSNVFKGKQIKMKVFVTLVISKGLSIGY